MIFADALPRIKTFLRPARLTATTAALLTRLVAAFLYHPGRMSCAQAAEAIRAEARHRAQLARFLARCHWSKDWAVLTACADLLLRQEAQPGGRWLFVLDQTLCSHQGQKTENTFSCGNHSKRPNKSKRKQKKYAKRSCHCFVLGLLITPSGLRIPCCRCYYTKDYCQAQRLVYHKQTELAAQLIEHLAVPVGAAVVVLGDTAFEAKIIRTACQKRAFVWIVPINPERVLAGPRPRPKVKSLAEGLVAEHCEAVRLTPGQGVYAAQQRAARCRVGPQAKPHTYWVHPEQRAVHNVGDVLLVFSTKEQPRPGQAVRVQKVLMSNERSLSTADVVALYDLRWQIELFFKELKSTLGLAQYRCRRFRQVEGWVQACLVAFCYLEWYRAGQRARPGLTDKQRQWWQGQRCHGIAQAVTRQAQDHDLSRLLRWSGSPSGLKRLRQALRRALPPEYRQTG